MQDLNFEKLTKRAISIYTQERSALLEGNSIALRVVESLKSDLLAELKAAEKAIDMARTSPTVDRNRTQLASLHSIIERRVSENSVLAKANDRGLRSDQTH